MFHSRNYGDYSLKKDKCISLDVRQFGNHQIVLHLQ